MSNGMRSSDTDARLVSNYAAIALGAGCVFLLFAIESPPAGGGAGPKAAGLLWAAACCAVGCFIGFIFGIPRTLSSDTARTTVPVREGAVERARAKAADSQARLERARAEKNRADVQGGEQNAKQPADKALQDRARALAEAEDAARKDQDALAALERTNGAPARAVDGKGPPTAINTNLEQISDWLTKIIVGVSLVNSERIGEAIWIAAGHVGESLGGGANRASLALAIMVYFSVVGLLSGYLLTRLFLQPAFNAASVSEP